MLRAISGFIAVSILIVSSVLALSVPANAGSKHGVKILRPTATGDEIDRGFKVIKVLRNGKRKVTYARPPRVVHSGAGDVVVQYRPLEYTVDGNTYVDANYVNHRNPIFADPNGKEPFVFLPDHVAGPAIQQLLGKHPNKHRKYKRHHRKHWGKHRQHRKYHRKYRHRKGERHSRRHGVKVLYPRRYSNRAHRKGHKFGGRYAHTRAFAQGNERRGKAYNNKRGRHAVNSGRFEGKFQFRSRSFGKGSTFAQQGTFSAQNSGDQYSN